MAERVNFTGSNPLNQIRVNSIERKKRRKTPNKPALKYPITTENQRQNIEGLGHVPNTKLAKSKTKRQHINITHRHTQTHTHRHTHRHTGDVTFKQVKPIRTGSFVGSARRRPADL